MKEISHPNIVAIVGVVTQVRVRRGLVVVSRLLLGGVLAFCSAVFPPLSKTIINLIGK